MEQNQLKLFTNGTVTTKDGREFTKLVGGFGEDKPTLTDKQVAELLKYKQGASAVRRQVDRNIKEFELESDIYIKDIKRLPEWHTLSEMLISLGYAKQSIKQAENIYLFSEAGFLLFLKFAEGEESVNLYKDFIEDYFKIKSENKQMKDVLNEELKYLLERKQTLIGKVVTEKDEAMRLQYFIEEEKINERIKEIEISLHTEELQNALKNQTHLKESKEAKYLNQADCGARFNQKLGAKTFGKLLKVAGLAKKTYKRPTPYEQYVPKYAINDFNNEKVSDNEIYYRWNFSEVIQFVDNWLRETGKYDIFYSLVNKGEVIEYINDLYDDMFEEGM
jgi:hypothetical protein